MNFVECAREHDAGDGCATPGAAVLRLVTFFSPAFPTGAFAFSHGLEAAIAEGLVRNAEDVREWASSLIATGSGWNDLVLFAEGWHAGLEKDPARLASAVELATALAGSRERREEALAIGEAFLRAADPWLDGHRVPLPDACPYAIASGAVSAACGLPLAPAVMAFAHAFVSNLVSAATRLVPLGQSQSVQILKDIEPTVLDAAERAAGSSLTDLGGFSFLSDIAAMRHEALQPRLFRS